MEEVEGREQKLKRARDMQAKNLEVVKNMKPVISAEERLAGKTIDKFSKYFSSKYIKFDAETTKDVDNDKQKVLEEFDKFTRMVTNNVKVKLIKKLAIRDFGSIQVEEANSYPKEDAENAIVDVFLIQKFLGVKFSQEEKEQLFIALLTKDGYLQPYYYFLGKMLKKLCDKKGIYFGDREKQVRFRYIYDEIKEEDESYDNLDGASKRKKHKKQEKSYVVDDEIIEEEEKAESIEELKKRMIDRKKQVKYHKQELKTRKKTSSDLERGM